MEAKSPFDEGAGIGRRQKKGKKSCPNHEGWQIVTSFSFKSGNEGKKVAKGKNVKYKSRTFRSLEPEWRDQQSLLPDGHESVTRCSHVLIIPGTVLCDVLCAAGVSWDSRTRRRTSDDEQDKFQEDLEDPSVRQDLEHPVSR